MKGEVNYGDLRVQVKQSFFPGGGFAFQGTFSGIWKHYFCYIVMEMAVGI